MTGTVELIQRLRAEAVRLGRTQVRPIMLEAADALEAKDAEIASLKEERDRARADLSFQLGQLRHAYSHLAAGRVKNQQRFAEGLISPAVQALERALSERKQP
jgi:hypothetical protein